jgi:hypothetical protein
MQLWTTVLYEGSHQGAVCVEAPSWYNAREICRVKFQDIADAYWLTLKSVAQNDLDPVEFHHVLFRDELKQIQERLLSPEKTELKKPKKRKK